MWMYKELYSCPLVIHLYRFEYKDLKGCTVLPVMNYRVSILVDHDGGIRVVSNIPFESWKKRVEKICMMILQGRIHELDRLEKVEAFAMFYGGIGSYAWSENELYTVLLDFVNRAKVCFYIQPRDFAENVQWLDLRDVVLSHLAFREGLINLLKQTCKSMDTEGFLCGFETSHGYLYVTGRPIKEIHGLLRIVPDNAPLRHVVSFMELTDRFQ
ncbi:MAG: hypothetical protein QXP67_01350 [Desulfurococcaceae archaeon]